MVPFFAWSQETSSSQQTERLVPRTAIRNDGHVELWRLTASGLPPEHYTQATVNGGFAIESFGTFYESTPAAITNTNGLIDVFGQTPGITVMWGTESPAAVYGFQDLGGTLMSERSAALDSDGRVQIFAADMGWKYRRRIRKNWQKKK